MWYLGTRVRERCSGLSIIADVVEPDGEVDADACIPPIVCDTKLIAPDSGFAPRPSTPLATPLLSPQTLKNDNEND